MGDYEPSTSRFEVEANFKHREGLIDTVLETILRPLQILTSPRFLQLYLRSILLFVSLSALLFLSSTASILFYYNYIPHVGHAIPIYLQFHTSQHPYSLVPLSTSLASNQGYDFTLVMHMPRTQTNKDAGNFMLDLALLKRGVVDSPLLVQGGYTAPHDAVVEISTAEQDGVIVRSRRPAILPYASRVLDTAHKFAHLPFFLSGWRTESETLRVTMFEGVRFKRGANPEYVQVTVQADTKMQFYDVSLEIKARFTGLRWAMYNHRILSFFVLTGGFFTVASTSTVLLYVLLGLSKNKSKTGAGEKDTKKKGKKEATVKSESEAFSQFDPLSTAELSDTAHTFPTRTGKAPLVYPGSPPSTGVKDEREDEKVKVKEEEEILETTHIAPLETITGVEGDDEDDGDNELFESAWRDSGIGTGVEDRTTSQGSARKRRG